MVGASPALYAVTGSAAARGQGIQSSTDPAPQRAGILFCGREFFLLHSTAGGLGSRRSNQRHQIKTATLESDIEEYRAATLAQSAIYAEIGTDEVKARQMRPMRWAAMTRRREAAENVVMSMLGHHRPALSRAGLVDFYESLAAGRESLDVLFKIADATSNHYGA